MAIHPAYKRVGISLAEVQKRERKTVIYMYYKIGIFWPFKIIQRD